MKAEYEKAHEMNKCLMKNYQKMQIYTGMSSMK